MLAPGTGCRGRWLTGGLFCYFEYMQRLEEINCMRLVELCVRWLLLFWPRLILQLLLNYRSIVHKDADVFSVADENLKSVLV